MSVGESFAAQPANLLQLRGFDWRDRAERDPGVPVSSRGAGKPILRLMLGACNVLIPLHMTRVAGVDGSPTGWAVVIAGAGKPVVGRVRTLEEIFDVAPFDIVAVDVPIGLLDAYEIGGRACDRAARKLLGPRRSSVFAAPVRAVLEANSWEEGCKLSRSSSRSGKAISKQT